MHVKHLLAGAVTAGAIAISAAPAGAAPVLCTDLGVTGSDPRAKCARIEGIDPGSHLNKRARPTSNSTDLGDYHNGDIVEVDCWARGETIMGDPYWVGIYGGGGPTYVPDYFVDTGPPASWTPGFSNCP